MSLQAAVIREQGIAFAVVIVKKHVIDSGSERAGAVGEYHRGLKQHTEVDRCQARLARLQANHVGYAGRAFVRLEYRRFATGVSWFEAKWSIIRGAVRVYLANPSYLLPDAATA